MKDKILFIGPKFFGYENYIIEQLEKSYRKVFYFCEYPFGESRRYYIFENIFGKRDWVWKRYEERITKLIEKEKIKDIFIIRGRLLQESLLKKLKDDYRTTIIHYQWDSVRNNPNALIINNYADITYTFDMNDANNYSGFNYLPLFYHWNKDFIEEKEITNDILYVGSCNLQRLEMYKKLKKLAKKKQWSVKSYLFLPYYLYIRLLFKGHYININDVKFKSLSHSKYQKLLQSSRVVVDVPSPTQVGSSMRAIESLSLRKKVITTNTNMLRENFYDKNNILLWDEVDDGIDVFLKSPFNKDIKENLYSIEEWMKKLGF